MNRLSKIISYENLRERFVSIIYKMFTRMFCRDLRPKLLVALADGKLVDRAKQLFVGAYLKGAWSGDYMLIAVDIDPEEKVWFIERGILVREPEVVFTMEECQKLYELSLKSNSVDFIYSALNKFSLFKTEFKRWKNIVYLDIDIIVRGSINELGDVHGFWAVPDMGKNNILRRQFTSHTHPLVTELEQRFNLDQASFNSGVMAFSTDIIEAKTYDELRKMFQRYNPVRKYADQAIFNLYFSAKWKKLKNTYNTLTKIVQAREQKIIHFAGWTKPWEKESPYFEEWNANHNKFKEIDFQNKPVSKKNLVRFLNLLQLGTDRFLTYIGLLLRKVSQVYSLIHNHK